MEPNNKDIHSTQPHTYTLRKRDKLRHRTLVDNLFANGISIYEFPLRLVAIKIGTGELGDYFRNDIPERVGKMQMLITVPKKKRRRAVDRVLMRRRIREAYRLLRRPLLKRIETEETIDTVCLAFIYLSDKNRPYFMIEEKMNNLLQRLEKTLFDS